MRRGLRPEVATVVDDVRYCGKSRLTADIEFSSESDPELTSPTNSGIRSVSTQAGVIPKCRRIEVDRYIGRMNANLDPEKIVGLVQGWAALHPLRSRYDRGGTRAHSNCESFCRPRPPMCDVATQVGGMLILSATRKLLGRAGSR
jgi:hypothetical protein